MSLARRRRWSAVIALALVSTATSAQVPIDDSASGMTCYYFAATAKLAWQEKGGDWIDAANRPFGDRAFSSVRVPLRQGRQQVALDVTPLAQEWMRGAGPVGAVFLRVVRGGQVNFASRENPDSDAHPSLTIEWDDGTVSRFEALADTHFGCPTHRSSGSEPVVQVGRGNAAIFAFPVERAENRMIRKASLLLTTDKQYATATEIGVFRPALPWAEPMKIEHGLAGRYVLDNGIETDPNVIFAERYESSGWLKRSGLAAQGGAEIISTDKANRFEPFDGSALKVMIPKGKTQGLNEHMRFAERAGGEPDEAYFRYYLRFGENWNPTAGGGKLPGFSGTYNRAGWGGRRSDGTNGWSARGQFYGAGTSGSRLSHLRGIGSYAYYGGMTSTYGEPWGWNLGPTGLLEKNRWYSVEQHVRLNTPGQADGVFRAWIDGKLVFKRTDINFRSVLDLRVESVWLNVYHGGTDPAPQDLTLYIDNMVVARSYIGPVSRARRAP